MYSKIQERLANLWQLRTCVTPDTKPSGKYHQFVRHRGAFAIIVGIVVVVVSVLVAHNHASSNHAKSTTTIPSAGPPLLLLTSCKLGTFSFPIVNTSRSQQEAGEKLTVSDNWPTESTVEVTSLVVVFYNNGKEVSSILASKNGTTYADGLGPSATYLTLGQSQSWTLLAGWTGSANSCAVVKLNTSPQAPQDQIGQFS